MTYNRVDDKIFIRLARGENIFTHLYKILNTEGVKSAWVNGIGAVENIEIGSIAKNGDLDKILKRQFEKRQKIL